MTSENPRHEIDIILEQLRFARMYTQRLLENTPMEDWFRLPPGGISHIGWQVGHLAMGGYRLGLERIRGTRPEDEQLLSQTLLQKFGRDSVPDPDPSHYPPAEVILEAYTRVHDQLLRETAKLNLADLDAPPHKPHALCKTRRETLYWCAQHQMVHAGQIGLLRRLLGHPPIW